jgi:hypothetical protein
MDTFSAVPSIQRFPITVIDFEKLEEFYASEDLDAKIPTVTKIFVGYEKGSGLPVPVQIEVDRIEQEYLENLPTEEEQKQIADGSGSVGEYLNKWRRVNMLLRRNLLLAVIRGLDTESANLLAQEGAQGREILVRLGFIVQSADEEKLEESTTGTENKKEGEGETGE